MAKSNPDKKKRNYIGLNKKSLAALYNVSTKTLNKWIEKLPEPIGEYAGKAFTPKQIKIIFKHIDYPDYEKD